MRSHLVGGGPGRGAAAPVVRTPTGAPPPFERGARVAGLVGLALGLAVLAGWALRVDRVVRVLPGAVSMKPTTAIGFVLAGTALLGLTGGREALPRWAVVAAATLVILGGVTLVEYVAGVDGGIEHALFWDELPTDDSPAPGRMAPTTAGGFVLLGGAMLWVAARPASAWWQVPVLLQLNLVFVALLGYLYDVPSLYGPGGFTGMALHTAGGLLVLGLGLLAARPRAGVTALVASGGPGGLLARRFLPAVVGLLVVVGWVRLSAERAGWLSTPLGLALMVVAAVLLLTVLALVTARELDVSDARRARAHHEVRRLNAELEVRVADRTRELEAANRELEAFSYSVSHDLRAPLRAIGGFSALLADEAGASLGAEDRHFLERIQSNVADMDGLIEALLGLSRVTRADLDVGCVDMRALAGDVLALHGEEIRRRNLDVVVGPLPACRGDRRLLREVLQNLVDNALKFTSGRDDARVTIGGAPGADGRVVYTVQDNGAGFDEQHAGRLFEVFQRLHDDGEFPGTGVGLAVAARIVARHGGEIRGESSNGETAFSFTMWGCSDAN